MRGTGRQFISVCGLVILMVCCLAADAPAQPPTTSGGSGQALLNLDNTVAVHGYDVVAYFNQDRARRGSKRIKSRLALGRLEDIDPTVLAIYQGKLYLFRDKNAKEAFFKDPDSAISQARENYFKIAKERRAY